MGSSGLNNFSVTIIGMGLMGASLAYDLRGRCRRVVGVVRRPEAVDETLASGCVDVATLDLASAVAEADMVILATPVRTILRQIEEVGPLLGPGAILSDMGSTKSEICAALNRVPAHVQVIGGHPMCGKEQAGLDAAQAGLYRDCTYVLSPLPRTAESTTQLMLELTALIGARPLVVTPERHDRLVAAISHLPYLTACSLVSHAMGVGEADPQVWDVAASGFRDSSRVAASNVNMLMDILTTNREAVIDAIDDYRSRLEWLRDLLRDHEEEALRGALEEIAERRQGWREGR